MQIANATVVSAAYALADRPLTRALLSRIREETLDLLKSNAPLPPVLLEEVIGTRDPELLVALTSATERRVGLFDSLAALGDPNLAARLYGSDPQSRTPRQRRAVWKGAAATADDPGWRGKDALLPKLLSAKHPEMLLPALRSPFPDLVEHALAKTHHRLSDVDQLRACRKVLEHGGVTTLLAMVDRAPVRESVADAVRLACRSADPDKALEEAVTQERTPVVPPPDGTPNTTGTLHATRTVNATGTVNAARTEAKEKKDVPAGGSVPAPSRSTCTPPPPAPVRIPTTTAQLIEELRNKPYGHPVQTVAPLDWDALIKAHRSRPLHPEPMRRLWARPDCPEEFAVAAFERSSGDDPAGARYWAMLTAVDFNSADQTGLPLLLGPGVASGVFPVVRVLSEIGPARKVLCGLPYTEEHVSEALSAQVARLGSDFAPWRAVFTLLPRFCGSVTELVDAALAESPKHRGKTWPKPLGPEFPSRRQTNGRTAWLHLFGEADAPVQHALGTHMDNRTIQQLLLWHGADTALRDHLVQVHGSCVLAGLASAWDTPAEQIEELIPYNDPEVNEALFLYTDLTDAQRRHILSGRRWDAGVSIDGTDRIPLTPALIKGLRESARRNWLVPGADSGDPLMCRILLGSPRVKLHTPSQELHMLVRLWERHGPDEVGALLDETDFPGRRQSKHPLARGTLEAGRAALESPDGLAVLRAAYEGASGPEGRAAFLCDKGFGAQGDELDRALDLLEEEIGPAPVPWAELLASHHVRPLPDRLLVGLKEHDCPAAIAEAAVPAELRLAHPEYRPRRTGRPPTTAEMLKKLPLRAYNGTCFWLDKAHAAGALSLADVVRDAFPAQASATFLAGVLTAPPDAGTVTGQAAEEIRQARRALAELTERHLGGDPEGWALALRLIPEFEGTLPELLMTAGAVVS